MGGQKLHLGWFSALEGNSYCALTGLSVQGERSWYQRIVKKEECLMSGFIFLRSGDCPFAGPEIKMRVVRLWRTNHMTRMSRRDIAVVLSGNE